jgi:UMF1 family MFS transporter
VLGWSLYDLANTIFFLLVVTRYVPEHLAKLTGSESAVAYAYVPAMLVSALLSPALGAVVDRAGRARRLTLVITIACCAFTVAMGAVSSALALGLLYAAARFSYEMAAVPYNALLPALASEGAVGRVSGIGVALGYAGNVLAFALILAFGLDQHGYWAVYLLAAVLFLGFTLPLHFWVVEPPAANPGSIGPRAIAVSVAGTLRALRRQLSIPARRDYLIGTFLVCDVVNTVLAQVARFAARPEGLALSGRGVTWFLLAVQGSCIVGGFLFGRGSDRHGGRRMMLLSVALLTAGLAVAQFLPGYWLRVTAMGTIGGAGLAGVWAAGRQWLVELVPRSEIGEAFGFYGLAQRASLVTLFPFTALVDSTGSYAGSVAVLLVVLLAGAAFLAHAPARAIAPAR